MEIHDMILNDYKPNKEAKDLNSFQKDEYNLILKLKKKADKAFKDGKFEKAYNLYNQALQFDQSDYDLIACLIGAALNLGYIDEVFEKSDLLIKMDSLKAQGYYLKGIANDLIFKFDKAIDYFLKALEYEKDHANIIVKNLVKSLVKYINKEDSGQYDDIIDINDDNENLVKLIELTDQLMKKRSNNEMVVKILNYVQSLDSENYQIKTDLLMTSGKYFKNEKNYDKAIITFEECFYLANLHEDYKLKIKSIVSISSCYLEMSDLHKVIYYYHKLIDIESYLLTISTNNSETNNSNSNSSNLSEDNMINIELRVAIRQNLFTAHYKLGKLRICCYYLNEIIEIIDKQLSLNEAFLIEGESFDLIQIKIDASIELIKLYSIFEEFILMKALLDKILRFIEEAIDKTNLGSFNEKQSNTLRYFKIKCYSYLGICLAGLREFRLSKLSTRKCLCLINKEIQKNLSKDEHSSVQTESVLDSTLNNSSTNDLFVLNSLKVECLIDASDASHQIIKTYKEMKEFNFDFGSHLTKSADSYDIHELKTLAEDYENSVKNAKSAYLLSKTLIDPSLRAQSTFNLGYCLYENQFYQSAAYYFSEVLSISTVLLDNKPGIENRFYTDASPDYRLEASVYLYKCQLLIDSFEMDSFVKISDSETSDIKSETFENLKSEKVDLEVLYKKLIKTIETLIKHCLKWKLHETNRSSFIFSVSDIDRIKHDRDSIRLKNLLKISAECLTYICYKLNKKEECLIYTELDTLILTSSMNDLIDLKLVDEQNNINFGSLNFDNFSFLLNKTENCLIRYKFIFDCKLLYVFVLEPSENNSKATIFSTKLKINQILNKYEVNQDLIKLQDSKFDYLFKRIDIIQNEWIKSHLHEVEYRNVPTELNELAKIRIKNRVKEKNYFNFLLKKENKESKENDENLIFKYNYENIDLLSLKLSDKLKESIEKIDVDKLVENTKIETDQFPDVINQLNEIFYKMVLEPIQNKLVDLKNSNSCFNILIDSQYSKMFVYTFNVFNQEQTNRISFLIILDTFIKYSSKLLNSIEQDIKENSNLNKQREEIKSAPNRSKTISDKLDSTNSDRVHKSQIIPRYTSNPRLAVNLLNEDKNSNYILIRNDHVQKLKNRLDSSITTLISETVSGTDAKRSHLEIVPYKQLNNPDKCCVIGCPEIPKKFSEFCNFKMNKFLKNGFEQLVEISKLLYVEPIFSDKMTKQELVYQLETNNLIFLSTLSSNESDSFLICSQSNEFPSSHAEFDKYCKLTTHDLELVDMHRCNLLVLNCYSTLSHKPRLNLAKKILSRGCKSVLLVLSPLTDNLMSQFYLFLFDNLKRSIEVNHAYSVAISKFSEMNPDIPLIIIRTSFCLLGSKSVRISINELAKSMAQLNVDKMFQNFKTEYNINYLNPATPFSILSNDHMSSLEKTLNQLQILIKFLLNQLIRDSQEILFNQNYKFELIFTYLNELVSKSIFYIKSNKIGPEPLNQIIFDNTTAHNLLKCLGFSIQKSSVYNIRDEKEKKVILFPDHRYLDVNLRLTHVMACLINLCFKINDEDETTKRHTNLRIRSVIFNLESLLPIDDKNLLRCLIDIIALTKFSPEIILSVTDYSVYFALNYYEYLNNIKNKTYFNLIEKDLFKWNLYAEKSNPLGDKQIEISSSDLAFKCSINNKVVNFLLSIGFEIIGNWIRFNDTELNKIFLDLILKFLTSFTIDRDMSLYKELNINVLGQRSAVTRGLIRTASNLNQNDLKKNKDEIYKMNVTGQWASIIETQGEMEKKIEFSEKYSSLSNKISKQRMDALRHHLNYVMKQSTLNFEEEKRESNQSQKTNENQENNVQITKIKYKTGGGPSKDRVIANEKLKVDFEEIEKIRQYSHYACQKNIEKIELEFKEKSQKLILPLIKK